MGGFAESVRERVRAARAAVEAARAADDPAALAVAEDELDDALRIARGVGVDPDRGSGGTGQGGAAE
ncbi:MULTISPECIES: hypothetical protein [Streptomyces]|uniref:hypothetical protein n=1 Tax=Streptomyces TaxID=1883 RepID=UPI001F3B54F7|nr:hypothetical protein [Streptomyces noursei]MCE4945907.1 hypothetical protein [Streptomyces noursei]